MKRKKLDKKFVLEYIRNVLMDSKTDNVEITDAKYHHNASYVDAPSIVRHGILSMMELSRLEKERYSHEFLELMDDTESHVNGSNSISLSVTGLKDLYIDEEEYDPSSPFQVDFLISSEVPAHRSSIHYGNEFLAYDSIEIDKLRSIDIRLLKYLDLIDNGLIFSSSEGSVKTLVEKYNRLRDIAFCLKQSRLNIPIREMSDDDGFTIDVDKLLSGPKLVLK